MSALGLVLASGVLAGLYCLSRSGYFPNPFFYFSASFILIFALLLLGKWLGTLSPKNWLLRLDRLYADINLAFAVADKPKGRSAPEPLRLPLSAIREVRVVEELTISWSTQARKRQEKTLMLELFCELPPNLLATQTPAGIKPSLERFRSNAVRIHDKGLRLVWRSSYSWISPGTNQALSEFAKGGVPIGQRLQECRDLTRGVN